MSVKKFSVENDFFVKYIIFKDNFFSAMKYPVSICSILC